MLRLPLGYDTQNQNGFDNPLDMIKHTKSEPNSEIQNSIRFKQTL